MMRKNLWIASGVAVIVVMAGLLVYGSYISAQYQMEALQTAAQEQWIQVDGAIRRWAKLTPQVEVAVAPVAKQDPMTLTALKSARQTLLQAHAPEAVIDASRGMAKALKSVMAIAASNENLQQDLQFQDLQGRLHRMQVRVAQDRDRYNESLRNYNVFIGEFPNSLWAKFAGFKPNHHFFPKLTGES